MAPSTVFIMNGPTNSGPIKYPSSICLEFHSEFSTGTTHGIFVIFSTKLRCYSSNLKTNRTGFGVFEFLGKKGPKCGFFKFYLFIYLFSNLCAKCLWSYLNLKVLKLTKMIFWEKSCFEFFGPPKMGPFWGFLTFMENWRWGLFWFFELT